MDENAIQIFITALLAAFGALARLLSQKEKTAVQFAGMVSGCLVAAFSGVMAHFISVNFGFTSSLTYVIAGISGWVGPQLLDILADMVLQKVGLSMGLNKGENSAAQPPQTRTAPEPPVFSPDPPVYNPSYQPGQETRTDYDDALYSALPDYNLPESDESEKEYDL